jgi:hypothetical protein
VKNLKNYFNELDRITKTKGLNLYNKDGSLRNVIDVLEDMYLILSIKNYLEIMQEIQEGEVYSNIFDDARKRKYLGVKENEN